MNIISTINVKVLTHRLHRLQAATFNESVLCSERWSLRVATQLFKSSCRLCVRIRSSLIGRWKFNRLNFFMLNWGNCDEFRTWIWYTCRYHALQNAEVPTVVNMITTERFIIFFFWIYGTKSCAEFAPLWHFHQASSHCEASTNKLYKNKRRIRPPAVVAASQGDCRCVLQFP